MDETFVAGRPAVLTAREQEIFRLVAEGLEYADIAARLVVSSGTVRGAMLRVRDKLSARTTAHAVLIAERHFPQLLGPVIARHGTREGADAHLRTGTPMCLDCDAVDLEEGPTARLNPFRQKLPKTRRLRPNEPVECGTMQAVRRHRHRGDVLSELTCGCREANNEYHRKWRQRQSDAVAA